MKNNIKNLVVFTLGFAGAYFAGVSLIVMWGNLLDGSISTLNPVWIIFLVSGVVSVFISSRFWK